MLRNGVPGLYWDWETGPFASNMIKAFIEGILYPWQPAAFGTGFIYVGYLARLLLIFLMFLTRDVGSAYKIFIFMSAFFSMLGMYLLTRSFKISRLAALFSGLLYGTSPFMLIRILTGHVYVVFSYAFTPLCLFSYFRTLESNKRKMNWIVATGFLYAIAASQFQWLMLLPITMVLLALIYCLPLRNIKLVIMKIFDVLLVLSIGLIFYLPWILLWVGRSFSIEAYVRAFSSESWLIHQLSNFKPLTFLTGQGYFDAYFQTVQKETAHTWILSLLAILIISISCFLKRPNKVIIFAMVLLLFSWAALSAIYLPLILTIWVLVYSHVPFVLTYLGEFYDLSQLSYLGLSILFAFGLNHILKLLKDVRLNRVKRTLLSLGILFLLLVMIYPSPLILSNYTQNYSFSNGYAKLNNFLVSNSNNSNYRVLWLPAGTVYGAYYSGYQLGGPDPLLGYSPIPAQPQGGAPYVYPHASGLNSYLSFLYNIIYSSHANDRNISTGLKELLNLGAFKYIVDRNDVSYAFLPVKQHAISQSLFSRLNLTSFDFGNAALYINNQTLPVLNVVGLNQACMITGGFDSVLLVAELNLSQKLGCKYYFFASQINASQLAFVPMNVIIVNDGIYDILYSFLPSETKVNLESYASSAGWYPLLFNGGILTNGTALTSNPDYAIASYTQANLSIPVSYHNEYVYILMKVFQSPSSSDLVIRISNYTLFIPLQSPKSYWTWKVIGPIFLPDLSNSITISGSGNPVAISSLSIIPLSIYNNALQETKDFQRDHSVTYIQTPLYQIRRNGTLLLNLSGFVLAASTSGSWSYGKEGLSSSGQQWNSAFLNELKSLPPHDFEINVLFSINSLHDQDYFGIYFSKDYSSYLNIYSGGTRASLDIRGPQGVIAAKGLNEKISAGKNYTLTITRIGSLVMVMLDNDVVLSANTGNFTLGPIGIMSYGTFSIHSLFLKPLQTSVVTTNATMSESSKSSEIKFLVTHFGISDFVISGHGTGLGLLVLLVKYDPNFVLKTNASVIAGPIPVNGYGMAWITSMSGNFRYEVEYVYTSLYNFAWLVSESVLISLAITVSLFSLLRKPKNKKTIVNVKL